MRCIGCKVNNFAGGRYLYMSPIGLVALIPTPPLRYSPEGENKAICNISTYLEIYQPCYLAFYQLLVIYSRPSDINIYL